MNVTASNEGLALISILIHASLVVQLVMLLLLAASLVSWTMIFRKRATLRGAGRAAADGNARGTSGLHRAGCWVTPRRGDPWKAPQRTDRRASGKGETVR